MVTTIIVERGDTMPDIIAGAGFVELDDGDDIAVEQDVIGADIMMTGNDIVLSDGDINIIDGDDNIIQAAINNMRIIYNELLVDPERGNTIYYKRLRLNDDGLRQVEYDCKNAIMIDSRVREVSYINAAEHNNMSCIIEFELVKHNDERVGNSILISLGGDNNDRT